MTTRDIREFLQSFPPDELKDHGILVGPTNLLRRLSVQPLLTLMREQGVSRLKPLNHDWFLDEKGEFRNKGSEERKEENIAHLRNQGETFTGACLRRSLFLTNLA